MLTLTYDPWTGALRANAIAVEDVGVWAGWLGLAVVLGRVLYKQEITTGATLPPIRIVDQGNAMTAIIPRYAVECAVCGRTELAPVPPRADAYIPLSMIASPLGRPKGWEGISLPEGPRNLCPECAAPVRRMRAATQAAEREAELAVATARVAFQLLRERQERSL